MVTSLVDADLRNIFGMKAELANSLPFYIGEGGG
jgi:hypothetical protein